jgi:LuxR family maltose regulon positive regulatory protein
VLSPREADVLRLLATGRSNEEIAGDLVLALSTVKWHVAHIYRKLGVRGRMRAVARARELRLIA